MGFIQTMSHRACCMEDENCCGCTVDGRVVVLLDHDDDEKLDRKWFLYSESLIRKYRKCSACFNLVGYLRDLPSLFKLFDHGDDYLLMKAVEENEIIVKFVPPQWLEDRKLVLRLVERNPFVLRHVHVKYREDEEILTMAIRKNSYCFNYAGPKLKENKEFVLRAARGVDYTFMIAKSLRSDREFVKQVVREHGMAIQFVDPCLLDDEEIVREAVQCNGLALKFASERLRSNVEIVRQAIERNSLAIQFASEEIQKDHLELKHSENHKKQDDCLEPNCQHIDRNYSNIGNHNIQNTIWRLGQRRRQNKTADKKEILDQIRNNMNVTPLTPEQRQDVEFALEIVKMNGLMLKLFDKKVQENDQILLEAIRNNGLALKYICMEKRYNRELIVEAAKQLVGRESLKLVFD